MGLFSSKDTECRNELDRLKLKLFGEGNTECLNVLTSNLTESILGGHRNRIYELENNGSQNACKRICQIVAVLLSILPKKDLDKKLDQETMRYGGTFPSSLFDSNGKTSVKSILEFIDP